MKKNTKFYFIKSLDMTNTGGPYIPQGTKGRVLIKRRDGRIFVDIEGFGKSQLSSYIKEN